MEASQKRGILVVGGLVALVAFLKWYENRPTNQPVDTDADGSGEMDYLAPYMWTNGFYPSPNVYNGSSTPFTMVVNNEIKAPALNSLNQEYVPMFGFVGVVAQ